MIDEEKFFDQPIKNKIKTYDNTSQGYYTTGFLLDYNYFKNITKC